MQSPLFFLRLRTNPLNRALFADHYLLTRLREDPAWRDNPSHAFHRFKSLMQDARQRWPRKDEQVVRRELYEPLFDLLGFQAKENKAAGDAHTQTRRITINEGRVNGNTSRGSGPETACSRKK